MIVRVRVVLKRTVVGDRRFDNLSGSHLQSQVNSVCQKMFFYQGLFFFGFTDIRQGMRSTTKVSDEFIFPSVSLVSFIVEFDG